MQDAMSSYHTPLLQQVYLEEVQQLPASALVSDPRTILLAASKVGWRREEGGKKPRVLLRLFAGLVRKRLIRSVPTTPSQDQDKQRRWMETIWPVESGLTR